MLYTATSIALACMETIVHLESGKSLPLNRYLVRIDVPDDIWTQSATLDASLNVGWDALPAGRVSIDWGTKWCAGQTSALALVPSVVIPEEFNVLVNSMHAHAAMLKATKIRKWTYDIRAVGR